MEKTQDQQKDKLRDLAEDLTGAAHPDIATSDENLSVDQMFQQVSLPSLGRMIFPVVGMNGPTAALFNLRKKPGTNDFSLVRAEAEVFPSTAIKTGMTQEAVQDIYSQYGKESKEVIGRLLRGLANDQENEKTLEFLSAQSLSATPVVLSNSGNARDNVMEVTQKVHTLILQANKSFTRTFHSYCVLPYALAASFLALNAFTGGGEEPADSGLFLGSIGHTDFFMNPDPAANEVFVGLSDTNPSQSAAVFSPYDSSVLPATDPDSGDLTFHIFNRFAITASPLHVPGEEMMFKFEVS